MANPRSPLVAVAFLVALTACEALKPKPQEPVPDAYRPDGSPMSPRTPPPPIRRLPDPERTSPVHLALFGEAQALSVRSTDGPFDLPQSSPTLAGIDLTLNRLSGWGPGFALRAIRGFGDAPRYVDAALLVGSRQFSADLGLALRRGPHIFTYGDFDSTFTLFRLGARSRINIRETGFSVMMRGHTYIPVPEAGAMDYDSGGWMFESAVSWTRPGLPLTFNLGYRNEYFVSSDRTQRLSGLTLGTGFIFGR